MDVDVDESISSLKHILVVERESFFSFILDGIVSIERANTSLGHIKKNCVISIQTFFTKHTLVENPFLHRTSHTHGFPYKCSYVRTLLKPEWLCMPTQY